MKEDDDDDDRGNMGQQDDNQPGFDGQGGALVEEARRLMQDDEADA